MLGWLRSAFRRKSYRRTLRAVHAPVRGRYDAAVTTEANRRHWANADLLSAGAANNSQVRRILRSRARYEVANSRRAKPASSHPRSPAANRAKASPSRPAFSQAATNRAASRRVPAVVTWHPFDRQHIPQTEWLIHGIT